jgi:hypothetical protein
MRERPKKMSDFHSETPHLVSAWDVYNIQKEVFSQIWGFYYGTSAGAGSPKAIRKTL